MKIIGKMKHLADRVYKQTIACEQYPMLTLVDRKKRQADGAIGLVYMLHHITEKGSRRIPTNEDLKVSPEFLEKIILKYKAKGFDFLSLDQLNEIIKSDVIPEHPFITFTIDDGYLDNYTKALPVFERQRIPFAIFVATDFIDKKAILWWDSIEDLIMTHNCVVTSDGKRYSCESYQERWDTFRYLRERILNLAPKKLEHELSEMFSNYDIDWYKPIKEKGMSWDQIKLLAAHPLCTIGSHTVSHPALNKLSFEEAKREIQEGIKKIENKTGLSVDYFAYPYGTPYEIGERECELVSDLNLKLAFMAHQGCITEMNKKNVTHLPRVYLKE